ncbi:MAG: hypothetical protein IPK62_15995 [Bacteroidetes bacterium]|nr:hypothetical protein [Bacteroidota bacterium]
MAFQTIKAQDLIVEYDFIHDKFVYIENGKTVVKPQVKKNSEIKVMVKNLNPFVFIARCNWSETVEEDNSSMSGIAGLFTGFAGGTEMLSGLISGLNTDVFTLAADRSDVSMFTKYQAAQSDMKAAMKSYNNLFDIEQSLVRTEFTTKKLKKLKYNPYMPSDSLKAVTQILTLNALKAKNQQDYKISATSFLQKATEVQNNMMFEFTNLKTASTNFIAAYNAFAASNGTDFSEAGLDVTIKDMLAKATEMTDKYTGDQIHNTIEDLEFQYESIIYTPYEYVCNYMANGDHLNLDLDFWETSPYSRSQEYYASGGDAVDTLRKIRTKSVNILVRGDMKINTGVGLGFPTYFNKNQTYSNRDSIITSTPGNNYAPCISTFISFYPYSGKNVHWGGCFGVGIPVQNEGTSNLNFFLGGSAVLGSNSKVGIHAGLAIGQLDILNNGQKTGDNLGDIYALPATKRQFSTGAFFGISFALNK